MQLPKMEIVTADEAGYVVLPGVLVGLKPELYAASHYAVDFVRGAVAGDLGEVSVVRAVSAFRIPRGHVFAFYDEAAASGTAKTGKKK